HLNVETQFANGRAGRTEYRLTMTLDPKFKARRLPRWLLDAPQRRHLHARCVVALELAPAIREQIPNSIGVDDRPDFLPFQETLQRVDSSNYNIPHIASIHMPLPSPHSPRTP